MAVTRTLTSSTPTTWCTPWVCARPLTLTPTTSACFSLYSLVLYFAGLNSDGSIRADAGDAVPEFGAAAGAVACYLRDHCCRRAIGGSPLVLTVCPMVRRAQTAMRTATW
jgi:hypothetical protein